MTESLLEKFNKKVEESIQLTQEEIKTLEAVGVEDLDHINKVGFFEVLQDMGKSFLGYLMGKPAKATEPILENAVVVLSDFEKALENELDNVETGRDAIEYVKRAIIRSRLRKRIRDAAQFSAKQIDYVTSGTETAVEPFIDAIEHPLAESAVALIDHVGDKGLRATQNVVESVGETAIGALETIKNIPSNVSNYAKNVYNSLPNVSLYSSSLWTFVDSASDFFYVACALILLGKFDFLLKNTYLLALIAVIIVYTIHKT